MLKSLDTNILVYAHNADAAESSAALRFLERIAAAPSEWIVADQALWELYRAIRNPNILRVPLDAAGAMARVRTLRVSSGIGQCAYEASMFSHIASILERPRTSYRRTHDILLAVTLLRNGVTEFYTHNPKDFADLGFERVIDPIAV